VGVEQGGRVRWEDLKPDESMIEALDVADAGGRRRGALAGDQSARKNWSNRFADACAQMVADAVRANRTLSKFDVRPNADGSGREALTFIAAGKRKRVDVIAATLASGLQVGISLKGLNFRGPGGNFDHNLTGRTYELQDEVGAIHEYQAAAFMVGLYFLPVQAAWDKKAAASSFARTVAHLRARSGRIDRMLPSQLRRSDAAGVALYVPGDPGDPFPRGVVRFFDVSDDPPRRGRPSVDSTYTLKQFVEVLAEQHAMDEAAIDWADPESDPPITTEL
jgi:hypothetical protein